MIYTKIFYLKVIASLMAAPGSLWVSKTIYPETKKTKADWDSIAELPKGLIFLRLNQPRALK